MTKTRQKRLELAEAQCDLDQSRLELRLAKKCDRDGNRLLAARIRATAEYRAAMVEQRLSGKRIPPSVLARYKRMMAGREYAAEGRHGYAI